jgi:hypothetical protein
MKLSAPDPAEAGRIPLELDFELGRRDFMLFNWAQALERPVLPFFVYTFTLLALASMIGIWPAGRVYAFAVLVPLLGYLLWIRVSEGVLWRNFPQLRERRRVVFGDLGFEVDLATERYRVEYHELDSVLESRGGIYLLRKDGGAEIVPKRALRGSEAIRELLEPRLGGQWRRSSYL